MAQGETLAARSRRRPCYRPSAASSADASAWRRPPPDEAPLKYRHALDCAQQNAHNKAMMIDAAVPGGIVGRFHVIGAAPRDPSE